MFSRYEALDSVHRSAGYVYIQKSIECLKKTWLLLKATEHGKMAKSMSSVNLYSVNI